ncbi:hypothetical protein AB6A23_11065 [Paenibacillus tarimensis]
MLREEIMNMRPGRELDALIAEKVMGWEKRYLPMTDKEYWFNPNSEDPVSMPWLDEWNPSTDIAAAFEVMEELQSSHLYIDVRTCADFYEVWITRWDTKKQTETIAYPKLPEAICKAALIAIL